MKIEVVEVYKVKTLNKKFVGTAHVYLCDLDMDLRGIGVYKKKDGFFCQSADRFAVDETTKQKVRYPVVRFTNNEKQKQFMNELSKAVTDYLLKGQK